MNIGIDGDILLYEIGFASEAHWRFLKQAVGIENDDSPPWDTVEEMIDGRISNICAIAGRTGSLTIFFTGRSNFRDRIAFTAPYKAGRGDKPFHYYNIRAYLNGNYCCKEVEGLEADDLLAMELVQNPDEFICCSRDKDLRAVPGWHFGWELGKQGQFGPERVYGMGHIHLDEKRKLKGTGEKFFYAQMIMGDPTDTIPGIPKSGDVAAFKLLDGCTTTMECVKAVEGAYKASYGLYWPEVMLEQGRLLHMTRELHADGSPVLWEIPIV
jgi:5'-3' exonuclease